MSYRKLLYVVAFTVALSTASWADTRKKDAWIPPIQVVLIDHDSLVRLGPWPFDRAVHAAVLDRITQGSPQAVVLNMYFGDRGSERGDAALAQALQKSGRAWILVDPNGREPLPALARAARGMGTSLLATDDTWTDVLAGAIFTPKGRYLNVYLEVVRDLLRVRARPQLSWGGQELNIGSVSLPGRLFPIRVDEATHYPRYTYLQVLDRRFDPSVFRGSIVVIGLADPTLANEYTVFGVHDGARFFPVEAMARALPDIFKAFAK